MILPKAGPSYNAQQEQDVRGIIEQSDKKNVKLGMALDAFYMKDTADGTIKKVVMTSGAFVIT